MPDHGLQVKGLCSLKLQTLMHLSMYRLDMSLENVFIMPIQRKLRQDYKKVSPEECTTQVGSA